MVCSIYSPFLLPIHSYSSRHLTISKPTTRHVWRTTNTKPLLLRDQSLSLDLPYGPIRALTTTSTLVLAIKSPASSGDYSIFIPVSAALFFVYWIFNFVVPDMILKDLQSEEPPSSREQTAEEKIKPTGIEEGSMPSNGITSSYQNTKKQSRKKSSKL
eukprot:TRINITY_DN21538_c0_g1_i1.p1 TRINITY_DN21538_c0_g1~~TRINITY_DN21538_c0_g1_i1.p1  ORF type:complete len:158 (+),score=11.68 TRINITY_DN21538_c0_g1_i1:143-616(+)